MRFFSLLLLGSVVFVGDLARVRGQQDWVRVPFDDQTHAVEIGYVSQDTCYAATLQSFYHSTDSGSSWQRVSWSPAPNNFAFVDAQHGYTAPVSTHTCYHTSDGGQTWTDADDSDQLVQVVCAISRDTCFLGGDIYLSRTTDAGKTWHSREMDVAGIEAIAFYNSKIGILVGDIQSGPFPHQDQTAGCFTTVDGGATWVQQYTGSGDGLVAATYAGKDTIIAVGGQGYVTRSTNGGLSWDSIPISAVGFNAIAHHGQRLLATAGIYIMTSLDRGQTWQREETGLTIGLLTSIVMFSDSLALASGANGVILRTTNGGADWVQVAPPSPIPLQTLAFPQPETASQEIEYSLPQLQHVTVRVYDLTGHILQTLLDKELQPAGEHRVTFRGDALPAGTYIYHIDTERYHASGKSVLVK